MIGLRLLALFGTVGLAAVLNAPLQVLLRWLGQRGVADAIQIGLCRVLCRILRLRVGAQGALTSRRPTLVVANHVSWTDILVLGAQAPLCFLAKAEVAQWPFVGWVARAHGTLFVSRRRNRRLPAVNRAMAARMASGRPVVLFAEGTTGNGTRLDRFRSGHLGAANDVLARMPNVDEVAVVPVTLAYTGRGGLPAGAGERMVLAWPGDVPLMPHVLALLRAGPVRCEAVWSAPVSFKRGDDRKVVMARVRVQVRRDFAALIAGRADAPAQNPVQAAAYAIWSAQTMARMHHDFPGPLP